MDIAQSESTQIHLSIFEQTSDDTRCRYAPFIWNAWNSPELLKIVSDVAGVELVPAVPHDVGHCNISVNKKDDEVGEVVAPGEQKDQKVNGYCESSFGWHTDSYPFVVVTMLSDCEGMVGGETAIRTGDGRVVKARGPKLVRVLA